MIELIINTICVSVLVILEIILYLVLTSRVLPRILKVRYSQKESRDRGLKKYVYPSGRGIAYEPRPAIRKYIPRYLLFTNNGYKYVKCRLDKGVHMIDYTVVMFNNRNEIIDVLEVKSKKISCNETAELLVHGDTSYVEVSVNSVNGTVIDNEKISYYRPLDMLIYTVSMAAISFAELVFANSMINLYYSWWAKGRVWASINLAYFIIPSIFIGAVCGVMALLNARVKGVRWSK